MVTPDGRAGATLRPLQRAALVVLALATCAVACRTTTPLQPVPRNEPPVVQSLLAFPTTIGVGDSAVVVCSATDPEGETLVYHWSSDCRLLKKGGSGDDVYSLDRALVVCAGACNRAPVDTGWVYCEVGDRHGEARAGVVRIAVRQ